ncbi:hypothetical protein D3C85_936410 [compost metagenome]
MPGKTGPGVIPIVFGVGKEHHTGNHQLDPGRAVDQPLAQGMFLFEIKHASIIGGQVAPGATIGDEPFDIAIGELIPVVIRDPADPAIVK